MSRSKALVLTVGLSVLLGLASPGAWGADALSEANLKTRLTLTLTRFVQWPGGPAVGEPLRLCLAQRNADVARAFADIDGQVVNGRKVQVHKAPPVEGCHVLYVHASTERGGDLVKSASGAAMLTVGDGEGFVAQGGMVELVLVNDAMRFDINLTAMRRAQVALSSQAMKLARQVRE